MNRGTDKIATTIARKVLLVQSRSAIYMNRKTSAFSRRRWAILIILFAVGWSLLLISITIDYGFTIRPRVPTISHFKSTISAPSPQTYVEPEAISNAEFLKIHRVHTWLDSLVIGSKNHFDSIMKNRPGLLDSIIKVERIYYEQQNKLK